VLLWQRVKYIRNAVVPAPLLRQGGMLLTQGCPQP
jgi:hypothetical protein